ncbi:hypothetical protein DFP72DRAFT_1071891 [Ephemerocybe angulata]|uniref:Uncharacterized protein n=1 Tax=Ephemerocybe angulata TaxID=980116 RepID=A0A8H6M0L9_9AGAR|nr:hypothetical protein DFP72DRAFT_1071891 [Tulosesus angulatus]
MSSQHNPDSPTQVVFFGGMTITAPPGAHIEASVTTHAKGPTYPDNWPHDAFNLFYGSSAPGISGHMPFGHQPALIYGTSTTTTRASGIVNGDGGPTKDSEAKSRNFGPKDASELGPTRGLASLPLHKDYNSSRVNEFDMTTIPLPVSGSGAHGRRGPSNFPGPRYSPQPPRPQGPPKSPIYAPSETDPSRFHVKTDSANPGDIGLAIGSEFLLNPNCTVSSFSNEHSENGRTTYKSSFPPPPPSPAPSSRPAQGSFIHQAGETKTSGGLTDLREPGPVEKLGEHVPPPPRSPVHGYKQRIQRVWDTKVKGNGS